MILKIIAYTFLILGFLIVFLANWIVTKYNLVNTIICEFEDEMTEDEILQYKNNKAIVNLKMYGMLIALPGLIMTIIGYKA